MFGIKLQLRKNTLLKAFYFEFFQIFLVTGIFQSHKFMFGQSWNIVLGYLAIQIIGSIGHIILVKLMQRKVSDGSDKFVAGKESDDPQTLQEYARQFAFRYLSWLAFRIIMSLSFFQGMSGYLYGDYNKDGESEIDRMIQAQRDGGNTSSDSWLSFGINLKVTLILFFECFLIMGMHCFSGFLGCFLREWAIAGNFEEVPDNESSEEEVS